MAVNRTSDARLPAVVLDPGHRPPDVCGAYPGGGLVLELGAALTARARVRACHQSPRAPLAVSASHNIFGGCCVPGRAT